MDFLSFLQEYQLNIMNVFAFGCFLLSLFSFIQLSTSKVRKNALLGMSISSMILLLADRQAYVFRGNTTEVGFLMTRVCNFLAFAMLNVIIFSFNWYLIDYFSKEFKITFKRLAIAKYSCCLAIVLLIISQFTDFYYYFDEQNCYHRAKGHVVCYTVPLLVFIIQLMVIVQNRRCFKKRMFYPLLFFTMVSLIASIAQIFFYGVSLTNISVVGLVMLLRIFAVLDTNYDAMASKRSYRDVMPQADVREQILKGIGSQFDPKFAQIMIDLIDEDTDYELRQME